MSYEERKNRDREDDFRGEIDEEIEALKLENVRLSREWQQCHERNSELVSEHLALKRQIAKWIETSMRLPEVMGTYVVLSNKGEYHGLGWFDKVRGFEKHITHWLENEPPQPDRELTGKWGTWKPKGVKR